MVLNSDCPLDAPGELEKTPVPGPHPDRLTLKGWGEALGFADGHQEKLTGSQAREPLVWGVD